MYSKSKMKLLVTLGSIFLSSVSFAQKTGNGGDICADRILEIAADVDSFILRGGEDKLNLPDGLSLNDYKKGMESAFKRTKVSCTDKLVKVGESERTCKNFVDAHHISRLLCNRTAFEKETSESDQYVLIHHEYAGIAGFEKDSSQETSNFSISNQITENLQEQTVVKLAVKGSASNVCEKDWVFDMNTGECLNNKGGAYMVSQTGNSLFTQCSSLTLDFTEFGNTVSGVATNDICTETFLGMDMRNGTIKVVELTLVAATDNARVPNCVYSGDLVVNDHLMTGTLFTQPNLTDGNPYGQDYCKPITINAVKN
jgi:hypothetical protein